MELKLINAVDNCRTCTAYSCLDCCQTFQVVQFSSSTPLATNQTACAEGLLEPACRLAYHGVKTYPCTATLNNSMAVAIINSNTHSHVHKGGEYADYSPCHSFYHHRYAVGIHNANLDDMVRFQSKEGNHNYVSYVLEGLTSKANPKNDFWSKFIDNFFFSAVAF
jgi:hypothetical protein